MGIVSMSGGAAVMLVDACARYGLDIGTLSPETQARLQQLSPPWMKATNPMDFWPLNMHSKLGLVETTRVCLRQFAADANIDALVLTLGIAYGQESSQVAQTVSELTRTFAKPICWWSGSSSREEAILDLEKTGVVISPSCERAIRTLRKLSDRWQFLAQCL
ncbi:MAG: hypothetical protein A2Y91_00990 [Chloroflexi bacterium RBG_13_54_8]|nr:MAG: hypothetical protein A2Y91_00990 [Chloroflexi bacterium RBG_13_54_8]